MAQLQETGAHFAKTADGGYMTTELGWIGRKAPGNLIQGVAMLEPNGPFFGSADDLMRFQPWLNDVAGHHWLSGYAGSIAQSWLWLQDVDDLLYFATPIVRGLVPVHAPLALNNRYYDFFQLCSERIVDCTDPRFRAVGMHSSYENAGAAFFRRHNDVLTGWRRQPLPGTHDVQEHEIAFLDRQGTLAYKVAVDEIPYGCFSDGKRVAIALTNPRLSPRTASFRLERDRYGMSLDGSYRVTVQRLGDGLPVQVLEGATGDLAFAVTLESRDYAMVIVEPVPYSWSSTPNLAGCDGGKLAGSTGGAGGIHVTLTVSDALPQAPGIMVYGYGSSSLPLPVSSCHLLVDPNGSIQVPFGTDANGRATLRFQVGAITALMQAITVDFTTTPWASLHATNAVTLHFP